jgi:hypothetical protein
MLDVRPVWCHAAYDVAGLLFKMENDIMLNDGIVLILATVYTHCFTDGSYSSHVGQDSQS